MFKMKFFRYIMSFNVMSILPSNDIDDDFMQDHAGLYHISCKLNEVCISFDGKVYGYSNIKDENLKLNFNFNNENKYDIRCGDIIYLVGTWD